MDGSILLIYNFSSPIKEEYAKLTKLRKKNVYFRTKKKTKKNVYFRMILELFLFLSFFGFYFNFENRYSDFLK